MLTREQRDLLYHRIDPNPSYRKEFYDDTPEGVIVYGSISLDDMNLTEIPINFYQVTGYFACIRNKLTSLKGCPKIVGDNLYIYGNRLTTMEGCPTKVHDIYCTNNNIRDYSALKNTSFSHIDIDTDDLFDVSFDFLSNPEEVSSLFKYIRPDQIIGFPQRSGLYTLASIVKNKY